MTSEWCQNRARAHDFSAVNGRAKAHKLWVSLGLTPSREKLHLQTAMGPSCATPPPPTHQGLDFPPFHPK